MLIYVRLNDVIMSNLAASTVALVVLVDLATGQGPPVYTNYLQQQEGFRPAPPPISPVGYAHRADYDAKKIDKEYEKAIELGKAGPGKDRKKLDKDSEKQYGEGSKKDENASPGMFSSLSNRMSGAWKTLSSFGREKRAAEQQLANTSTDYVKTVPGANLEQQATQSASASTPGPSNTLASRESENSEHSPNKHQGYIYFKVPRHLVCGQLESFD